MVILIFWSELFLRHLCLIVAVAEAIVWWQLALCRDGNKWLLQCHYGIIVLEWPRGIKHQTGLGTSSSINKKESISSACTSLQLPDCRQQELAMPASSAQTLMAGTKVVDQHFYSSTILRTEMKKQRNEDLALRRAIFGENIFLLLTKVSNNNNIGLDLNYVGVPFHARLIDFYF